MAALEKEFYSRKELADLLGVTPLTVYRLVQRGEIDHYLVGRVMRFRREDIEAYLATRKNVGKHGKKTAKKKRSKK